jgi:hypothetical protein
MHSMVIRGVTAIAVVQGAVALAAFSNSGRAAAVSALVGLVALGRYAALSSFASSVCLRRDRAGRRFAVSAWILSFLALGAVIAAVGAAAGDLLPWAAAAAFAGPVFLSIFAFGSGLGALAPGGKR